MFRNIIIVLLASVAIVAGQSTSGYQTVTISDSTGILSTNGAAAPLILGTNQTLTVNKVEAYLTMTNQAFTAAAGFEVVTNFSYEVARGNFTTSHSNIVCNVAGDYMVICTASLESSAALTFVEGHIHTNGVEVMRTGWSRTIGTANDQGSAAGISLVPIVSGSSVTFEIDVDKNATLSFDHLSLILIQQ